MLLLAFIGGVLTIVSPCILPVLPFVFSRADRSFLKNGLPLLAGMALTFAGMASLAAAAGTWIVHTNQVGRYIALLIFAGLGISLLFPPFAEYLSGRSCGWGQEFKAAAPKLLASVDPLYWEYRPACCGLHAPRLFGV